MNSPLSQKTNLRASGSCRRRERGSEASSPSPSRAHGPRPPWRSWVQSLDPVFRHQLERWLLPEETVRVVPGEPDGYLLGSYRIATAPEPNSSRLTSFKSTRFDSP